MISRVPGMARKKAVVRVGELEIASILILMGNVKVNKIFTFSLLKLFWKNLTPVKGLIYRTGCIVWRGREMNCVIGSCVDYSQKGRRKVQ